MITTQTIKRTTQKQDRYDKFIAELTRLTHKYGVAIQSVGGVFVAAHPDEFKTVGYIADSSSNDLMIDWDDLG